MKEDIEIVGLGLLLLAFAGSLLLIRPDEKLVREAVAAREKRIAEIQSWKESAPLFYGLRLALPFDGTLEDRSHLGHAVSADRPAFHPRGRHGASYVFRDGNYITIPDYSFSSSGTWAFWFRLEEDYDLNTEMRLLDTNGAGVIFNDGELTAYFHDGRSRVMNAPLPETGRWHHLALTWDSANLPEGLKLYLNGEPADTARYSGAPGFPTRTLRIGVSWRGLHPFSGMIDEFYAFDRALLQEEIEELMETPAPETPWFREEQAIVCLSTAGKS